MRLSEKLTHISADGENFSLASKVFSHLKMGLSKNLGYCFIGKTDSFKACISAKSTIKNNLVVLAHSLAPIERRKKPHIRYLKPHLLKIFVM